MTRLESVSFADHSDRMCGGMRHWFTGQAVTDALNGVEFPVDRAGRSEPIRVVVAIASDIGGDGTFERVKSGLWF